MLVRQRLFQFQCGMSHVLGNTSVPGKPGWLVTVLGGLPHELVIPGWTLAFREEAQNTEISVEGWGLWTNGVHCRVLEDPPAFALRRPANVGH